MTETPPLKLHPLPRRDTVENIALAGAEAIKELIQERNELSSRVRTQEKELASLRHLNGHLQRRVELLHNQYLSITTKFVDHLKEIDNAISSSLRQPIEELDDSTDETLVSLAKRFSPSEK